MPKRRLSQRQKERIRHIQERRRKSLAERAEQAMDEADGEAPQAGRVITRHGHNLAVIDEVGTIHHCLSRQNIGNPVCGDRVVWSTTTPGQGVVTALLERDSVLARPDHSGREKPLAANITQIVVVIAPEPEPGEYLLDQYLITAEVIGVPALIAINKIDLLSPPERTAFDRRFSLYGQIGYPLAHISAHLEHGLDPLSDRLKGETSILVGQSGVGKSSLINALVPDQGIQVGRLSGTTGLGRHTTSATTCYKLPQGGDLIDSPGVRSFRLLKLSRTQLEQGFPEFSTYLGQCQFSDCLHDREPVCAIKAAAKKGEIDPRRLENFLHLARGLSPEHG